MDFGEAQVNVRGRSGDAFEIDPEALASVTELDAFNRPTAGGVFVQQKTHTKLTLEYR